MFLKHLYDTIPTDKFVQKTFEKGSINLLDTIIGEKIVAIKQETTQLKYKWDSIHPNIHMVNRLIECVDLEKHNGLWKKLVNDTKGLTRTAKEVKDINVVVNNSLATTNNIPEKKEEKKPTPEVLRDYQEEAITKIFKKWSTGKRSVLFQMPTGTGKTVIFNEITHRGDKRDRKILIVVHRIELIDQITKKLVRKGITVGHIIAGVSPDYSKNVQVASIQTFTRREDCPAEFNLIIIDECHHATAQTYRKLWELYPTAKFLGVTATPWRLSKKEGFDDLFDELIVSMSIEEFIKKGHLVPVLHYAKGLPNLSNVKISNKGDYVVKMLSEVMLGGTIMADIIGSYKEKCYGKSTIVFAVDVEHSKEVVRRYRDIGIKAEHIDSKTPPNERERIIRDFRNKRIQVISNVEIITEGFDFPACEVVQLARPTKSLTLYLQMVGRVMRPAPEQGKEVGIILDNAGLWQEHHLSTIERHWSLKPRNREGNRRVLYEDVYIDKNGIVREVEREIPREMQGLYATFPNEIRRLTYFETILSNVLKTRYKLLSAYRKYEEYVNQRGNKISKIEFEYIKRKLMSINHLVEPDRAVKQGFWHYEEQRILKQNTD